MEGIRLQVVVKPEIAAKVRREAEKSMETVSQWMRKLVIATVVKRVMK